jgi:hypothetical protein
MIKDLVREYYGYDPTMGIERLLEARKKLSVELVTLAEEIADLEEDSKKKAAALKVNLAKSELTHEGSIQDRKNKALEQYSSEIIESAILEGQLRGKRIFFDSAREVLNSMSSYLNKL